MELNRNAVSRRRPLLWLAVAVAGLALNLSGSRGVCAGQGGPCIACTDPRGCPDLIEDSAALADRVIEVTTFSATSCPVLEGEVAAGTRRLLRFTTSTPNIGAGSLIVGNPANFPTCFNFMTCHGHPHFADYGDYRLWTPTGFGAWRNLQARNPGALPRDLLRDNPNIAAQMVSGRKQGFCVIDLAPYLPPAQRDPPTFGSCGTNQGISVGWADVYSRFLDGQWIDITGLASGWYVLEVEVNTGRLIQESNYSNNAGATKVFIP